MNMSDEFPVDLDQKREDDIIDLAKTLMGVNDSLASLTVIKEELTARMAALCQHRDEGQSTYKVGKYAIVCKSGISAICFRHVEKYSSLLFAKSGM